MPLSWASFGKNFDQRTPSTMVTLTAIRDFESDSIAHAACGLMCLCSLYSPGCRVLGLVATYASHGSMAAITPSRSSCGAIVSAESPDCTLTSTEPYPLPVYTACRCLYRL